MSDASASVLHDELPPWPEAACATCGMAFFPAHGEFGRGGVLRCSECRAVRVEQALGERRDAA